MTRNRATWGDLIQFEMGGRSAWLVSNGKVQEVSASIFSALPTAAADVDVFFNEAIAEEHAALQRQIAGGRS